MAESKEIDVTARKRAERERIHAEMAERQEDMNADRSAVIKRVAGYVTGVDKRWPGSPMLIDEWMRFVAEMNKGPKKALNIQIRWEDLEAIVQQAYVNGKRAAE